jgi:glycosyltransferase involved in cell wall biosynthesis
MLTNMRILCVNSIISEFGGVEFAAMNLAHGLAARGHQVHFLGAQGQKALSGPSHQKAAAMEQNRFGKIRVHYRVFPRRYALGVNGNYLSKALWHIQDLADPANERTFSEVAREVAPDVIILHNITAIGLNIWRPIRKSGTPCIQVIHDLSLICFNMSQFRSGRHCSGLCVPCRLQKWFRFSLIRGASNFVFVAPSRATLNGIERYAPLSAWRTEVISNPNAFFVKPRNWQASDKPRFLYVGRLDPSKGVDMMLRAAQAAQTVVPFNLDILGAGTLEQSLRQSYANSHWVRFHGVVSQEAIADFMSRATALLVPSLWLETVPGVAVHALFAGLPVIASRIGGIPEHIEDGLTGRLLPPGDEKAWSDEIARIAVDPQQIAAWSTACPVAARRFNPRVALDAYEKLIQSIIT